MSVFWSISQNIGVAPVAEIAWRVATYVIDCVMTSSPSLILQASKAKWIAAVPLTTHATGFPKNYSKLSSNFFTSDPIPK